MMFHSTTGSGRGSEQSRGLRGVVAAAVVFLFLPAAAFVTGGCSRAPAYVNYRAKHTAPEDYDAAGSGPTRPLAMTGQVVVSADPLWKQYAARTQAFVTPGAGVAAQPRTGGSGKITADKDGAGKSSPARSSRKATGKKTGKTAAKKDGKSAPPQMSPGSAGLFPEPVCPEGCVPASGYRRATQAPAQSSTPDAQPSAPVPDARSSAPVPSVTPSTAFTPPPGPAGPASVPDDSGKATPAAQTPASTSSPEQTPASTSSPAPAPAQTPASTSAPAPPSASAPAPPSASAPAPPSASAPAQTPASTNAPATVPAAPVPAAQPPASAAQPEAPPPPALPMLSTPSGAAVPGGGSRLLPPVGGQAVPERDPALAPPGSSGLGYIPAPPPQ